MKIVYSGIIAENFVVCELLRLGYSALAPASPQNKGWDLLVLKESSDSGTNVKLQVKAVTWGSASSTVPTIRGSFDADFDYLVIVIIGFYRTQKYAIYVVPKCHIRRSEVGETGQIPSSETDVFIYKAGDKHTIPFSRFSDSVRRGILNKKYRNNWTQMFA